MRASRPSLLVRSFMSFSAPAMAHDSELHTRTVMRGGKISVLVLNKMQVLDQEVPPSRPIGREAAHFDQRLWIDLTPLGGTRWPASAFAPGWLVQGGLPNRAHR